jgi:hypothetical protein
MGRRLAVGFACVATLFAALSPLSSHAATTAQVDSARAKGLAWLFQNQKGDGSWSAPSGLQVQATSEVLNAYLNAGIQNGDSFYAGVANLANTHPASIDGQARQLAALRRTGSDVSSYSDPLQTARNVYKGWGSLPGHGSTPTDTALALTAMLDAVPTYAMSDAFGGLCNAVLTTQRTGGGWSYQGLGGNVPATAASAAIVPTAYAVLATQKVKNKGYSTVTCSINSTTYTLATVIGNGVAYLKTKQNGDGGFGDTATSGPLETALAYQAINAVSSTDTALTPAQNYLVLTAQQANGSWANDPFQTALVLETFPTVTLANTAHDGVPDAVKTVLGLNTAVPVRGLLSGNGLAVAGVNTPILLPGGIIGNAYAYTLAGSGGTGPYAFGLASGALPDGLTLASNGAIAGTPGALGAFSFTYQSTDSVGAKAMVEAQIQVTTADAAAGDVPTLPEWGVMLLGSLLLASTLYSQRRR